VAESAVEIVLPSDGVDTQGKRKGRRQAKVSTLVIEALGALGHSQRGRILRKLLEGPATYRALQGETGLRAGPLYHHIHQLRLAGLMLPKERDLYELSRGGRNLVVVAAALEKLVRDRRRLP
jgi:DNA-binding HxlR family transcriptional regulator